MNAYQCWQQQRDTLKSTLAEQDSMADVAYAVRHAILQTEQNTLAEQTDDVLRQQMGVLFSMMKNSVGFLETPVTSTAWVAQAAAPENRNTKKLTLGTVAALFIIGCGLLCYFKGLWLGWAAALGALITGGLALLGQRKARPASLPKDELRVTLSPDGDKLIDAIDAQMRFLDRCVNDFAYLNEGLRGGRENGGSAMIGRVSNLLEALYECDEEARAPAWDAVQDMLRDMGLKALDYSEESRKLFTALPSRNETRTIAPAIVSLEDYRLLKRGTAAVKSDAA